MVSALNGLLGDRLHAQSNGLAIDMGWYRARERLELSRDAIRAAVPDATGRLCLLVHGLGCHEGVWALAEGAPDGLASYGEGLERECGFTAFFLRYNSGLPVAVNGDALATQVSRLLACYPSRVREVVLIGHSMGGLVIRSACHRACQRKLAWVDLVSRVFYLGTPHDGADLEGAVHIASRVLSRVPHPVTHLIADVLGIRSQGIKDLRHGDPRDADVVEDAAGPETGRLVPWLGHAAHHLMVGTLTEDPAHPMSAVLGDGLVGGAAARARARRSAKGPGSNGHIEVFPGLHHLALANSPVVYARIRHWCGPAGRSR